MLISVNFSIMNLWHFSRVASTFRQQRRPGGPRPTSFLSLRGKPKLKESKTFFFLFLKKEMATVGKL